MGTRPPPAFAALQSALEAQIEADVATTLGPLLALREALDAYETAVREQVTRDTLAALPELATARPAPDVPAARRAVLAALREAAGVFQASPAALARIA